MNAAETIAAAIEKLEQLKGSATPGFIPDGFARVEIVCEDAGTIHVVEPKNEADIDLAVTLHRTIDAQLGILRDALADMEAYGGVPMGLWSKHLDLARAILNDPEFPSWYWVNTLKLTILDPDGWDRANFKESWAEPITRAEFMLRARRSTVPDPLEDNPYDLDQYDIWIDDSDEEHGA